MHNFIPFVLGSSSYCRFRRGKRKTKKEKKKKSEGKEVKTKKARAALSAGQAIALGLSTAQVSIKGKCLMQSTTEFP